jgi:hypothetical protein
MTFYPSTRLSRLRPRVELLEDRRVPARLLGLGGAGADAATDLALDRFGNRLVAGTFTGTVDFDPGPATIALTSAGGTDGYLAKYTPAGNLLWALPLGGPGDDAPHRVAVDFAHNVYVAGAFSGDVDFNAGVGVAPRSSAGGTDVFVAKFSPAGGLRWVAAFGGPGDDAAADVRVDDQGSVYLTGTFTGDTDVDAGLGVRALHSHGGTDAFAAKFDSTGRPLWAHAIGGQGDDRGAGVAVDPAGFLFLSGSFTETVDFDPGPGVHPLTSAGGSDGYLVKYTWDGFCVWAESIGGPQDDEPAPGGLAVDDEGDVYVGGSFEGTADFDPSPDAANLTSVGDDDFFLAHYATTGAYEWAVCAGAAGPDAARRLTPEGGGVVVTGTFSGGAADFDPGPGATWLSTQGTAGAADAFVARYDADGRLAWADAFGAPTDGGTTAVGVACDPSGFLVVAGRFAGSVDFDPGAGVRNLDAAGGSDAFVLRLDAGGLFPAADTPPRITGLANVTATAGLPTPLLAFTVSDDENLPDGLDVSATSSDPTLVPDGGLSLGGSNGNCTLVITPTAGRSGTATITVRVSDLDGNTTTGQFQVTVAPGSPPPVPPPTPGLTGPARLVDRFYRDLLGRAADPQGLAAWTGLMNQGLSAADVALRIQGSREYQSNQVNSVYFELLGRAAEPQGLDAWVGFLNAASPSDTAGTPLNQMRALVLASPEYRQKHGGTDAGFLAGLYRDVLDRDIDPFGATAFGAALFGGATPRDVAGAILTSGESARVCVNGLYQDLLHRPADEFGLSAFAAALQGGADEAAVVAGLLGSAEYAAL